MKKSLILKGIIAILIVFIFATSAIGCELIDKIIGGGDVNDNDNDNDNIIDDGNDDEVVVDKTALNAEIALEVKEQGDFTTDSFNAYKAKLNEAKTIAADENATQVKVDTAAVALKNAREALTERPVEAVGGASKEFKIISGGAKEITLSDYVNTNGLSKITYKLMSGSEIITLSDIADGKFTITAGEVVGEATAKVSINVYYDNVAKLSLELTVKVTNDVAPILESEELVKEIDLATLVNKESVVLNFAENVNNIGGLPLTYSAKLGDEQLTLDGANYTYALGSYTVETVYVSFDVTVSFSVNGEPKTLVYTYKLGVRDTGKYSVVNGSFENGLEGWEFNNTLGEAPFAGIDEKTHFWPDAQNFPMFNVGKYFSSYADGASEGSQGTLASSYFTVNSKYATYMLGGAGNPGVYITIENKDGEVLALYRNTKFADIPADVTDFAAQRELLGKSVFLANLVTYKVDLSGLEGKEVRFVIHDYASEGWGVVFFDELITYYASEDELPEGATLAENLLANKTALRAELALEVAEQGDFTEESYNAYLAKLNAAKEVAGQLTASQEAVDAALAALTEARLALAVRPVEEIEGADREFKLTAGNDKEITLSDYVNVNGLSGISYKLAASSTAVTLSEIVEGKFTITAGDVSEATTVKVTITVSHGGVDKLTVELSVQVTDDQTPSVKTEEVSKIFDLYDLENKGSLALDLSENVENPGKLALTYSVNGRATEGSLYTVTLGSYTDKVTYETLTVTVSYTVDGNARSVSYTYKLGLKDTIENRLENGGFENGMDGWTQVGNIGGVSSDTHYWVNDPEVPEGFEFGMDGDKMFSAYASPDLEKNVGTLTSASFKVGGSGFVTFKLGAAKDANYVYVDVVEKGTGKILARYYNGLWADRTNDVKSGCTLIAYKADLSAFAGKEVFFRISDNADSGYGLFFVDSFITYYESEPEGFNNAVSPEYTLPETIYDVFNGGFEMGDVQGWWNDGQPGAVTGADKFFSGADYGKDGDFLYSGVEDATLDEEGNLVKLGNGREGNRGVLTSSAFELGGTGYISFMLGGGGNALCYVQVIDATTGELLARYHQQAMNDAVLVKYVADLSAYIGRTLRVQVVDYAERDWGCVSFDNLDTYHESKPEGTLAEDIKANLKYTIDNGSFESGNADGWTMNITEAGTQNTLGWVLETEIDADWYAKNDETKDGKFLFTFAQPGDINCESSKGTLESSTFSLKQGAFVAFRFGGAGGGSNHDVFVELCRADGSVIARFYNDAEGKVNTKMNAYYYQYNGAEVDCFFRVVDNSTADYGCFVVDDFRVNLESAPEGFMAAIQ